MAFIVPRAPLTPRHRLALDLDPAARIVRAHEIAAYREAEALMAEARAQAEAIVIDAHAAFEAAQQRGYDEGRQQAAREAAAHMAEQVARTDAYHQQAEDRLVDVVVQALRKIVMDYSDRERALQAVRSALALVRTQKQVTVRVHPEDAEHVRAQAAALIADYPAVQWLDVVPDPQLGAGCCVLETDIGIVESSVQAQLDALEAALRQARGHTPG
jgi:type III secretion protein L